MSGVEKLYTGSTTMTVEGALADALAEHKHGAPLRQVIVVGVYAEPANEEQLFMRSCAMSRMEAHWLLSKAVERALYSSDLDHINGPDQVG